MGFEEAGHLGQQNFSALHDFEWRKYYASKRLELQSSVFSELTTFLC